MKKTLISGALALAMLTGTAGAAAPAVLPEEIGGGSPSGITAVPEGGYLLTDTFNKVVWQVSAAGEISRLAGQVGVKGLDGVPIGRYTDGTLETAFFTEPWDISPVLDGWAVSDTASHVVRYVDENGVYTLVGSGEAGRRDATGTAAEFSRPTGLATDQNGNLYIADTDNGAIRRMNDEGEVTTVLSGLSEPTGLCWQNGELYIAETGLNRIRVWDGTLTTVVGGEMGNVNGRASKARLASPQDVAVTEDGVIYIADTGNGAIRKLEDGQVTTVLEMAELDFAPILPRSLLLQGDTLLITDPFAPGVLELELTQESFQDVPEEMWCHDAVYRARALRLTGGTGNGMFSPNRPMTRAHFVTMLGNLQETLDGGVVIDGSQSFTDIPEDLWCAKSVRWAADQGITQGNNGQFLPNQPLTRQQLVTFLWKFATMMEADSTPYGSIEGFEDADQVAPYARDAMAWAIGAGLLQGNDGKLNPTGQATRAHGVVILVRFMDWLQK